VEKLIGFGLPEKQLDKKSNRYHCQLTAYQVTSERVRKTRYQNEMGSGTMNAGEVNPPSGRSRGF